MTFKQAFKRCFCDENDKLTIVQFPNLSGGLTVALIVLGWIFSTGLVHSVFRGSAAITGLWWAYLEVRYGVNYFRRGLGAFVVIMILMELARNIKP